MIIFGFARLFRNVALAVILLDGAVDSITPRAFGQANTATVYGTVTDASGAVIPKATVTLTREDTGQTTTKITGETGDFGFKFIPVGDYNLRIEAPGLKSVVNKGIALTPGQQMRQTFALKLAP